jgi:hypothetical protein
MQAKWKILGSVFAFVFAAHCAKAQPTDQAPATGLIFTPSEAYQTLPKRPRVRGAVGASFVDLSMSFPVAGHQRSQGSCAAWAVGYGVRSYYLSTQQGVAPQTADAVSPSYIFNQTTPTARGQGPLCGGVNFPDTLDFLKREGAVNLGMWPYDASTCQPNAPNEQERALAAQWRIPAYSTFAENELRDPRRYREVLAKGHPVIVAMQISVRDFMQYRAGETFTKVSSLAERPYGHGVVMVGFDETRRAFLLYNSWGPEWGERGKMWIGYDAFFSLVREAYVVDGLRPPAANAPAPAPSARPLRDRLAEVAAMASCGAVQVRAEGDAFALVGFAAPEEAQRIAVAARAVSATTRIAIDETPWPACEARLMLADALSSGGVTVAVQNLDAPEMSKAGAVAQVRRGDSFRIDVTAPAQARTLQVIYLQADRSAKELYRGPSRTLPSGASGVRLGGGSIVNLQAEQPFGPEAVVVIAADAPVLDFTGGVNVEEHAFLDRLRVALAAARAEGRSVAAGLVRIDALDRLGAERWIVTPGEAAAFMETAGADPYVAIDAPVSSSDAGGPLIQPASGADPLRFNFVAGDSPIAVNSLRLRYRAPTGWIDVTSRLGSRLAADSAGARVSTWLLPPGRHRLRLSIVDIAGRVGDFEWTSERP